ncbi:hypothetical protein AB6A40_003907 [Gnathostoma spinigerum]|uniref:Globin domain-containing protein n=1 Tax=Gnathostoma spinigerum TaxID=75299 RepID=A0ABD6EAX2_9BILA
MPNLKRIFCCKNSSESVSNTSCSGYTNQRTSNTLSSEAKHIKTNVISKNDEKSVDELRTALSKKQKYVLTKNWKGISRDVTTAGANMFVAMLSQHSEYFPMFCFHEISSQSPKNQLEDEDLRAHGTIVMEKLGEIISNIEDDHMFFKLLDEVGRDHADFAKNGFRPHMFWEMERPFLYAVKLVLGDRYTDSMDHIYKIVIKVILERLEKACEDSLMHFDGAQALA